MTMTQRRALNSQIDDEVRRWLNGDSTFAKYIELALERSDPLTRKLVLFRAAGGDYRQAMMKFNISDSQYYRRLQLFRQSLIHIVSPLS